MKSSLSEFHSKEEVAEAIVSALQRSTEMTYYGEHQEAKLHRLIGYHHIYQMHTRLRIHKSK